MSDAIRNERAFFFAILKGPREGTLRKEFLRPMSKQQTQAISQVAQNVLCGTLGLSHAKKLTLRPMKPFFRSLSIEGQGPIIRKRVIIAHPTETFTLVETVFRNLDELIWRAN